MATFYSRSNNQRDLIQTLYLRDPVYTSYPESPVDGNMLHLNSSFSYSDNIGGNNGQSHQDFFELPLSSPVLSHNSSVGDHDLTSSRSMEHSYNVWRSGRIENFSPNGHILNRQSVSLLQSNVVAPQGQGLSLSLGTQIPMASFTNSHNSGRENDSSYGLPDVDGTIQSSRYLKTVQELLEEVVNVRKALRSKDERNRGVTSYAVTVGCKVDHVASKNEEVTSNQKESTVNSFQELLPSERRDLQDKIIKLLAMLDEVDRRYREYFHQMQIVASSFDMIAGSHAAKPYTALALQTISRHFRSLRDAIDSQIRSARKSLGEEDSTRSKDGDNGIPRLRYIVQKLRQRRAMQHLGMMQAQSWRPQRGLPENSVSILRGWLFEHFLHPYPNDSDKMVLARQTGLSRSQVSNWFINSRVRLWKPMIEEMYKEEVNVDIESNSSSDINIPKNVHNRAQLSENRDELQRPVAETGSCLTNTVPPDLDFCGGTVEEDCSLVLDGFAQSFESGKFMAYRMGDPGRYGGNISLTLGLKAFPAAREDIYAAVAVAVEGAGGAPPLGGARNRV